jgi:hypothetical protein
LFTMDAFVRYGCFCSLWMLLFTMDAFVHYGCFCSLWVLLFTMDTFVHYGCFCSLWMLLFTMDAFDHYGYFSLLGRLSIFGFLVPFYDFSYFSVMSASFFLVLIIVFSLNFRSCFLILLGATMKVQIHLY